MDCLSRKSRRNQRTGCGCLRRGVSQRFLVCRRILPFAARFAHFPTGSVQTIKLLETTFQPPENFDPLAHLLDTIASMSGTYMVEAFLKTTLEDLQKRLPRDLAMLEAVEGGVLLRTRADDL